MELWVCCIDKNIGTVLNYAAVYEATGLEMCVCRPLTFISYLTLILNCQNVTHFLLSTSQQILHDTTGSSSLLVNITD